MPRQPSNRGLESKNWCLTLNNPKTTEEHELFKNAERHLEYAVWQVERAPTTSTVHIQGYIILSKGQNRDWVIANVSRGNWIIAHGSAEANRIYCSKIGGIRGPWVYGAIPENHGDCWF